MKKNDIIELEISGIDFPAKPYGFFENDNRKFYANINLAIGQRIRAKIGKIKNNKVELRDIEILNENIIPFCKKFNLCGGCSFQYFSFEKQALLKEKLVFNLIEKSIKNREYKKLPIILVGNGLEYRNKMEYSFGNEVKDGPLLLGLHKKNSFHDIVLVNECGIIDYDFKSILKFTNRFFENETFYHRISHIGFLRNLVIRKGEKTKELSINIITTSQRDNFDIIEKYKEELLKLNLKNKIVSIIHTINDNKSDMVKSDKEIILYGKRDISEILFGLKFNISPYSFFQTNYFGIELLYKQVINFLKEITNLNQKPIVFDLFSGTGTIGQIVAKYSKWVYGIELIEEAVEKANENAKLNNLNNVTFLAGDVFEKIDFLNENKIRPDVLILDPPRSGVGEKTILKLIDYDVDYIIYVSCNPKTLAEDLKIFEENNYFLEKVICVDMFPYTPHIETVTLLHKIREKVDDLL